MNYICKLADGNIYILEHFRDNRYFKCTVYDLCTKPQIVPVDDNFYTIEQRYSLILCKYHTISGTCIDKLRSENLFRIKHIILI